MNPHEIRTCSGSAATSFVASEMTLEEFMAKALFAAAVNTDPRMMAELFSLRARVVELERELDELRLENAAFEDEVRSLSVSEAPTVLA